MWRIYAPTAGFLFNEVNSMAYSITYFGLFPKSSDMMKDLALIMFPAIGYISIGGYVSKKTSRVATIK